MVGLNLYNIKLQWFVQGDEEPSYTDDSVLAINAEDAVDAAKERLLNWEVKDQKTDVKKITFIRLHECKMEYEDIDIISRAMVDTINNVIHKPINQKETE